MFVLPLHNTCSPRSIHGERGSRALVFVFRWSLFRGDEMFILFRGDLESETSDEDDDEAAA
jgi:hypothetical protein